MLYWVLLVIELLTLFLTSRVLFQALFGISLRIFKKPKIASIPVFLLFLPGVVVHELSHFLMAEVLFVRTGHIDIAPHIENNSLRMGSVQVRESDIVRRMLIGVAPVIVGTIFLLAVLTLFTNSIPLSNIFASSGNIFAAAAVIWMCFFTVNTMFSSKKDMEGTLEFGALAAFVILIIIIASVILKINLLPQVLNFFENPFIVEKVRAVVLLLSIPAAINVIGFILARLILRKIH